ncbi:M20 family metallopeptidase [uncultured Megasphaera sp.]|uniref:M20 metallopeptidase family protein n=1 Tax=uncultured Megasphaera sp. TaxID=165188 RepID=UPI0026359699|nr:M20 family metallopeptidase [uncultured Megasphaera sp.]
MKTFLEMAQEMQNELVSIRRDFHQHPELSWKEYETTKRIKEYLTSWGIEVIPWGGDTGVIGLLKGAEDGPVVALRGDIDALPVTEETGESFASVNEGCMHACGHDIHITTILGAAALLAKKKDELKGSVKFIFQPAEEAINGADTMVKHGVLENPQVDAVFGVHNNPELRAGQIGLKPGPLMAATDGVYLTVKGRGGHGGIPNLCVDPVVAAAAIITNMQSIIARRISPLDSAVISWGSIHAGEANHVIPDSVTMSGTVRSYRKEVQAKLKEEMERVIHNTAASYGCTADFEYRYGLPVVDNDKVLAEWLKSPLGKVFGDGVIEPIPNTGAEDFAFYMEKVPGVFLWLGVGNPEQGICQPWHSPKFRMDESALALGAAGFAQLAFDYVNEFKK